MRVGGAVLTGEEGGGRVDEAGALDAVALVRPADAERGGPQPGADPGEARPGGARPVGPLRAAVLAQLPALEPLEQGAGGGLRCGVGAVAVGGAAAPLEGVEAGGDGAEVVADGVAAGLD